ncbi:MAG: hypothetical protein ACKOPS_07245, partial [Cyanobium sp.]
GRGKPGGERCEPVCAAGPWGESAIGNVVGSNLLNQLVILGLCATVSGGRGLEVDPLMIQRDLPIMVLTTLA